MNVLSYIAIHRRVFGRSFDHLQCATQAYKQHIIFSPNAQLKLPVVLVMHFVQLLYICCILCDAFCDRNMSVDTNVW